MGRTSFSGWLWAAAFVTVACGGSSKTPTAGSNVCVAGSRVCDGLNVKVCADDGSKVTIAETCLPTQSCSDGVCTETSCLPNTKFCKDGNVFKCDGQGAGSALSKTCAPGQFCLEEDDDAACSDAACTAGQPMCDGDVATVCKMDGSGPQAGGTPCSDGQVCFQGTCRDQACTEGMKVCQHDDVYLCANNGSDMALLADCQAGEVCDAAMGACRPKVCDPGKVGCDSTRVVECNEFGSGWEQSGTDCATDNELCLDGACKKQTCTASSTFCQDGNVFQCDSSGVSSTLYQVCTPDYYHCEPYFNYASCQYNQCTPGTPICDGNVAKVCTETGSYPPNGTPCTNDQYCDYNSGTCKVSECELYTYFCKNDDVYYCGDYYGGQNQVIQYCPSDTACKVIDNSAACVPFPCPPGETSCLGNKVGTCADDGQSLGKVTEDCTATSNVCGSDGKCIKSAVDILGVAENAEVASASMLIGDVIEMDSARKLVSFEMNLVLASPRELRWVVYEQSGNTFTARIDKLVQNQTGTGFISSGALNYNLKAGKRYLLAVAVNGGEAVAYYDTAPYDRNQSFGSPVGGIATYYSSTISADYYYSDHLYQLRTTTELP